MTSEATLEPLIGGVLDAGTRYVRAGSLSIWEYSHIEVEGPWIKWLRRISERPNLFLGWCKASKEYFLGLWVVRPGQGPELPCFVLVDGMGKTAPDHAGPSRDRPSTAYLMSRLKRSAPSEEKDRRRQSVSKNVRWRERMISERQHNATWSRILSRKHDKFSQVLARELERGIATLGPEGEE